MENQENALPIDKINKPLEEYLTPEELAIVEEMRANVQIKDSTVMDPEANPLYTPLVSYEKPENMEIAKTLARRVGELKRQNAPLHLLPEKINAFFTPDEGNRRIPAVEFCEILQQTGNITTACAQIRKHYPKMGLSSRIIEDYRVLIPTFSDQIDFALEMFNAKLEEAAVERAVEGVDEPIYYQGEHVGDKKKYSDDLLKFLMQANNPEKYGKTDNKSGGAPIVVQIANFAQSADYGGDNGLLTDVTQFNQEEKDE